MSNEGFSSDPWLPSVPGPRPGDPGAKRPATSSSSASRHPSMRSIHNYIVHDETGVWTVEGKVPEPYRQLVGQLVQMLNDASENELVAPLQDRLFKQAISTLECGLGEAKNVERSGLSITADFGTLTMTVIQTAFDFCIVYGSSNVATESLRWNTIKTDVIGPDVLKVLIKAQKLATTEGRIADAAEHGDNSDKYEN